MTTRKYSSRSQQTTLAASLTDTATSCTVVSGSALLGGASVTAGTTFTVVIDPDTALEEIVDVTVVNTNVLTITRGVENSGTGQAHSAGAAVRHMAIGRDFREANLHIEATGGYNDGTGAHTMHGIAAGEGVVVGTDKTQTLTAKTLTSPIITNPTISGAGVDASIVFEGAVADAHETTLTVEEPTADRTITLPNATGTVVLAAVAQTLTNKTIDMTGVTLTGLSSAGMSASSATPKDYVDSILGSATSAATSAASAATSATSAATSATSAAASAVAAASSATASASSATAAATSATSAAASATAAATSATSAAASATTAANSVATIAGYATASANSATAAATSATSAATSASSALTSANSAATSASTMNASVTAAATSAASAASSATAAATSATSAAASATAANTSAINAAASESVVAASASAAATSATSASNSATAAATSATSASTSASSALTSQTAAATSASSASTSASSALTSATSAATSYDEFDDRYLGAKATPPTVDNDGNALLTGALYWNTSSNKMFVWSGTAWAEISSSADIISYKYTVAGGATSVSGADDNGLTLAYTVGKEQVYINGVLQVRGSDYTATTGSSITGITAMIASDIVTVLAFTAFSVSNTYTQAEADAKFFQNANAFVAGKNKILNGDFGINQRNFSSTTTASVFTFDRWTSTGNDADGTCTWSAQTFTPGTAPVAGYEGKNYIRIVTTGQTTAAALARYDQRIEDVRNFAGQTVTVSFWAQAGTGTPNVCVELQQVFGSGGSPSSVVNAIIASPAKQAITTSWARYSFTISVPSLSGKTIGTDNNSFLTLGIYVSAGSNFNARTGTLGIQSNTFNLWGIQIEAGSVATPFQTATGTLANELVACQRYYARFGAADSLTTTAYATYGNGYTTSTTNATIAIQLPVTMRIAPTVIDFASLAIVNTSSTLLAVSAVAVNNSSNSKNRAHVEVTVTGATANVYNVLQNNNSTSGYIGFSAEI